MSGGHVNRDGSWSSGCIRGRGGWGFWKKVLERPDGCWIWIGFRDRDGAGKFCTVIDGHTTTVRAARFAWEQLVGPVPAGDVLLAVVCWNSRCVNPAHRMSVPRRDVTPWLHALGRPYEYADMRGEMSGRAILNAEAAKFIRAQAMVRGSMPLLARLYGVSVVTVQAVKYRKSWRHLRGQANATEILSVRALRELVEQREEEKAGRAQALDEAASARQADA